MNFDRYIKNTNAFSKDDIINISTKKVCIVGVGGLGGYVSMLLARFGVLNLTLIDGDVFSITNLNRQLFATEHNLGLKKVTETKKAINIINSEVIVTAIDENLSDVNKESFLQSHDLVIDCLDNIESRFLVQLACNKLDIPFVHGAISGFYGQVCFVKPNSNIIDKIYKDKTNTLDNDLGNPPFIPAIVASIQASEAIKYLTNKGELLINKILFIDLLFNDFETIEI